MKIWQPASSVLSENVPLRLLCLKTWSTVGELFGEVEALAEGVASRGLALRVFKILQLLPVLLKM